MAQSTLSSAAAAAAAASQRHRPSRASRTSRPARPPPAVLVVPNLAPLPHPSTLREAARRREPAAGPSAVPARIRRGSAPVCSLRTPGRPRSLRIVAGSRPRRANALSRTRRARSPDVAIEDIRRAPPAPRSEDIARACPQSREEDEVGTFDTAMPNTIAQFDDELQTIAGTLTDATDLTAGGRGSSAARPITWRQPRPRSTPVAADRRLRIHIDGGRHVRGRRTHRSRDQRPAQCAAAARRRGRNAARAPRAGARAASGGCGQGEGVDRPPVSRSEETGGTGFGATTASLRRRSWRARLTRRLRASVRAATPMKRMEAPHEAWSPCMATRISGAGSSGNNDERTAERSGRSGRVIQPLWNIVANAAIRTGTNEGGDLRNNSGSLAGCLGHERRDGGLERGPPVGDRPAGRAADLPKMAWPAP